MNAKTSILVFAVCVTAGSAACGESVKDTLSDRYKGHVLALRTPFTQGKMKFNSTGQPLHAQPSGPWLAYGGLHVEKLGLSKETLQLEGHRVGFTGRQKGNQPVLINLGKAMSVEIQLDRPVQSADDANAVLNRVFFLDAGAADRTRPEWRRADDTISGDRIYSVGQDNTKAPVSIYTPEPDYSDAARKAKFQGTVALTIVVDKGGRVARVRLDKALGFGLDENALQALSIWRFAPAIRNGQPVAVEMSTEFSFNLY
jgi:TonB family protein